MCAAAVVPGSWDATVSTCRVHVFGNIGFVRFALSQQGYGAALNAQRVREADARNTADARP
jgi:hypothetical protein